MVDFPAPERPVKYRKTLLVLWWKGLSQLPDNFGEGKPFRNGSPVLQIFGQLRSGDRLRFLPLRQFTDLSELAPFGNENHFLEGQNLDADFLP